MANEASRPIFGRKADLDALLGRLCAPGLTIVTARPQQGKTRLLEKLVELLRAGPINGEAIRRPVGYCAARAEMPDQLLRSLSDLYEHWLKDSTLRQQACVLAGQQQSKWIEWFGAAGNVLAGLLKTFDPTDVSVTGTKLFFDKLLDANSRLITGDVSLPRLSYDQALNLLQLVYSVTTAPAVVILDAFEWLQDPQLLANNLRYYLERMHEWPPVHFILSCREPAVSESEAIALSQTNELKELSAVVSHLRLGPMQLGDLPERDAIIAYLHDRIPIARQLACDDLLEELDGYPGTLNKWREGQPKTIEQLRSLTEDARKLQYRELEPIFERLYREDTSLFDVASRAALLPETEFGQNASPFQLLISGDRDSDAFDRLVDIGLLVRHQDSGACSFGLTARYERAKAVWLSHKTWEARRRIIFVALLGCLAESVTAESPEDATFINAMKSLVNSIPEKIVEPEVRDFVQLFRVGSVDEPARVPDPEKLAKIGAFLRRRKSFSRVGSVGFFVVLTIAMKRKDLDLCGKVITEMRKLAEAYPGEYSIRKRLAGCLFVTLLQSDVEVKISQQLLLLDELRLLSAAHPDEQQLWEWLAGGYFRLVAGDREDPQAGLAESSLNSLRAMAIEHPGDPAIIKYLADSLYLECNRANVRRNPHRRDMLLDELRMLYKGRPDDPDVVAALARGLCEVLVQAINAEDVTCSNALNEELRILRDHFAKVSQAILPPVALFYLLEDALARKDWPQCDALLEELRVSNTKGDGSTTSDWLAKGLCSNIHSAFEERKLLPWRDLLQELRELSIAKADVAEVRESFARALTTAFYHTMRQTDGTLDYSCLNELRTLSEANPADSAVRERFAASLTHSLIEATNKHDWVTRDALLFEEHGLYSANPNDPNVRDRLAAALSITLMVARGQHDVATFAARLQELRTLSKNHPDDANLRKRLSNAQSRPATE